MKKNVILSVICLVAVLAGAALWIAHSQRTGVVEEDHPNMFSENPEITDRPVALGAPGAAADPSPKAEAPGLSFEAKYIRTNGYRDGAAYPQYRIIGSRAELLAYYEEFKDVYDLERREQVYSDTTIGFLDAVDGYDDDYFSNSSLIVVLLEEGSGSIRHQVTGVRCVPDMYIVDIQREVPEVGTCDMAEWHILIEIPGAVVSDARGSVEVRLHTGEDESPTSGLIGVGHTDAVPAWSDPWGIKLTVKDISPAGLTLVCTQQDGQPSGELMTGSPYALERFEGGEWVQVEPLIPELMWTMEGWMIHRNGTVEWPVNWSGIYGELPAGQYRISKSIMDHRAPGDNDQKDYYAGFDLIAAADGARIECVHDRFGVSLPCLPGWEYEIEDWAPDCLSYGVNYRPAGADGWIRYHYWPFFGVCGTGLEEEPYGTGWMGTYDDHKVWDFIAFPVSKDDSSLGSVVATTDNVLDWWDACGVDAMSILDAAQTINIIVD